MIDNLYRKRVSEKKTLSIVRKLCKFCMRTIFAIFNLCNDWRICSIEYSVRFAHTARVCRWRSKPIRALVKGSATRLLDMWRNMCPTMLFVGHGINKCLRGYAPGMYECLRDNIWAIAHMPRWVITSWPWLTCVSRVIQCEPILPITAKFIRVCTMYVQCIPRQLAWFYHGSWRVFDTCSVRFAHTAHDCC